MLNILAQLQFLRCYNWIAVFGKFQRFLARIHRANKLSTEMDPERFLIYTSTYMVEFRFFIPVLYLELSITLYDYNNRQTSLKFKEKTLMPNDVLSKNVSEWGFFLQLDILY